MKHVVTLWYTKGQYYCKYTTFLNALFFAPSLENDILSQTTEKGIYKQDCKSRQVTLKPNSSNHTGSDNALF